MSTVAEDITHEAQLRADIERLRGEFRETPALYREVCALLFFRYGITPTANKLYQLVRKGSMATPAQALSKFWEELRTKTRLRIEHPDLPEELRTLAGEVTATLWGKAQALAHESLDAYRSEAQATVTLARSETERSNQARDTALAEVTNLKQSLVTLQSAKENLQQELVAEQAAQRETRARLAEAQSQNTVLQASLKEAHAEYSRELEKQRGALQLAQERYESMERRSLLDIDKERTQRTKLEKEIERVRAAAAESQERYRTEDAARSRELAALRQQLGKLEGERSSVSAQLNQLQAELVAARDTLARVQSEADSLRGESAQLRERMAELART
ncbi:MAG: DNA-binding protein, partial [Planctomycetota bacterium]